MNDKLCILFLHGLGDTESVWQPVIARFPSIKPLTAPVLRTEPSTEWSLDAITARIATPLTEPVHLVGLSLGAIVALNIALQYPEKALSLFVSAPQVKPSRLVMGLQSALLRALPTRWVCPPGLKKPELLGVLEALRDLDLTPALGSIRVPTTVACGSKDRPNLSAARYVSAAIPQSHLEIILGVGHQWHKDHPDCFAAALKTHLSTTCG